MPPLIRAEATVNIMRGVICKNIAKSILINLRASENAKRSKKFAGQYVNGKMQGLKQETLVKRKASTTVSLLNSLLLNHEKSDFEKFLFFVTLVKNRCVTKFFSCSVHGLSIFMFRSSRKVYWR